MSTLPRDEYMKIEVLTDTDHIFDTKEDLWLLEKEWVLVVNMDRSSKENGLVAVVTARLCLRSTMLLWRSEVNLKSMENQILRTSTLDKKGVTSFSKLQEGEYKLRINSARSNQPEDTSYS